MTTAQIVFPVMMAVALAIMLLGLVLTLRLKRIASGGTIGKAVNIMIGFITLFTLGYGVGFLIPKADGDLILLFTGTILLLGAAFVLLVLWLIRRLMIKVLKALEMVDE